MSFMENNVNTQEAQNRDSLFLEVEIPGSAVNQGAKSVLRASLSSDCSSDSVQYLADSNGYNATNFQQKYMDMELCNEN